MAQAPADYFITAIEDSRRWRNVVRRPGDIIISTPPKSGTTLTQGIVTSLLWPKGDEPGSRSELSPWVDVCVAPIEMVVAQLEAQTHRRYMKTHSPGDCIPFDDRCRYIVVYRDGRDALVSWGNHRATMRVEVVQAMNAAATARGVAPIAETWNGDYDALFDEWVQVGSSVRHLASWWPRRHAANVLFVHYTDLRQDLRAEMQRIAAFLELTIDEADWDQVVDRCQLDSMRAQAEARGGMDRGFEGGAAAFFYKGTNGRWHDLLTEAQIERYLRLVEDGLEPDAANWLENGSLALGSRPGDFGEEPPPVATASGNPMYGRIKRQTGNSVQAISERRVDQAREDGLFDNLALHGKPIPDLDQQRPAGWWAQKFVKTERNKVKALQLEDELRKAMPALWRLETEAQVESRVDELNDKIAIYNKVTTLAPMASISIATTLATWRDLKSR